MKAVEFRLTMPRRGSWDNKWSGEGKNYTLTRELDDEIAVKLEGRAWTYYWPDGWCAKVTARLVQDEESSHPSDGFKGYGWMVDSIVRHDKIFADHERPPL